MTDPTRAELSRPSSNEEPSPYVAQTLRLLAVTVEMVTSFERSWNDPLLVDGVRHAVAAFRVLDPGSDEGADHELDEAIEALAALVASLPTTTS